MQDQVELSRYLQVIGGVRFDRFDLTYHNNRNGDTLEPRRQSRLAARRGGRQADRAAVALLQLQRVVSAELRRPVFVVDRRSPSRSKPEKFNNYEVGAKWDLRVRPVVADRRLSPGSHQHPVDGSERSDAHRADRQPTHQRLRARRQRRVTPAWQIAGGYAYQDAFVTSATTAAHRRRAGGQVPHHTLSLWNNYQIAPKLGAGIGVLRRTDMFAAIDNTVTLPGYTRADAAVYLLGDQAVAAAGQRRESVRQALLHQRRQQHQHLAWIPAHAQGGVDGDVRARKAFFHWRRGPFDSTAAGAPPARAHRSTNGAKVGRWKLTLRRISMSSVTCGRRRGVS